MSTQEAPTLPSNPPPTTLSKRKKRKRKKNNNSAAAASASSSDIAGNQNAQHDTSTSILHSKLSLKKQSYLKKSAKLTPWYDTNELLEVGRGLLVALKLFPSPSSSACSSHQVQLQNQGADGSSSSMIPSGLTPDEYTQLQSALSRIALWKARSDRGGGRLSHAIDMSAGLAGILLLDAQQQQQQHSTSTSSISNFTSTNPTINQLRQTYSTILLRSVNGLADSFRSQKKSATLSVSHCCVALAGLPSWLVDIRHDASHNDLPSLGVCRIGALEMLKYWREKYWNVVDGRVWGGTTKHEKNDVGSGIEGGEGAYTLAYDCLLRYQRAAMKEAVERDEKSMQLQKHPSGSAEVGISRRARLRRFARENKAEENEQDVNSKMQDEAKEDTMATDAAAEDDGMIPIPADKSTTSRKAKKRASTTDTVEKGSSSSGGNVNFFSILYDDKPKQKKKKTKVDQAAPSTDSSNAAEKKVGDINNANDAQEASASLALGSKTLSEDTAVVASDVKKEVSEQAKPSPPAPTSRDCASEFIRTVPMDIAFSSTLRFLVWGLPPSSSTSNVIDETGYEVNGPAVLALPSSLVNSTTTQSSNNKLESAFEHLRLTNESILISMINAYPGFIKALFVHLVDSLLCLDEARQATSQLDSNNANKEEGNEMIDLVELECNIHHLVKWIQYLLSREFHMHFDRSVAMFVSEDSKMQHLLAEEQPDDVPADVTTIDGREGDATQQTPLSSQPIDLKKKGRKKWNSEELVFMQSPLDYKFLNEVGLPLNSICDRLDTHQRNQLFRHSESGRAASASSEDSATVHELYQFMECIIRKQNRVLFMGLCDNIMWGLGSGMTAKEYSSTDKAQIQNKQQTPLTTNAMSLEDIEAMVLDVDETDDDPPADTTGKGNDPSSHSADYNANFTGIIIQPWTLCQHWDACAIGTMPGCPN